jgi:FkbM family methyltransferase
MTISTLKHHILEKIVSKNPYMEQAYWWFLVRFRDPYRREAEHLFSNYPTYRQALQQSSDGTVTLHTHDDLNITLRQNVIDARIVREIFFQKPYLKHFSGQSEPIVVDIGAYIGDFSLYAAHYLGARVIAYEPAAENFSLLKQNIDDNNFGDHIYPVMKAIGPSKTVNLNVMKDGGEVHVSAYWYIDGEHREVESETLEEILVNHELETVDLMKIDCEGCEYDVLLSLTDELSSRIHQIVLEWHKIADCENRLAQVRRKLVSVGYSVLSEGQILYAIHD